MNKISSLLIVSLISSMAGACVTVHRQPTHVSTSAVSPNTSQAETAASGTSNQSEAEWQLVFPQNYAGNQRESSNSGERYSSNADGSIDTIRIGKVHLEKKGFQTVKAISEKNIFMQEYDYSCGAASLATLMHYYFGDNVTEQSLLNYIQRFYTPEEYRRIENDGLSFLELEQISKSLGYQTASVRLKMESLEKLRGPVVVYVARDDYRHFAVLKGVFEDRVFIADPSRGNIRMSRAEFAREWDGRTFILGKKGFGNPDDHAMSINEMSPLRKEIVMLRQLLNEQPPLVDTSDQYFRNSQLTQ